MANERYIAVAGGANIDIGGKSFAKVIPNDSNPGTVKISLGGVGRNIAHNLSLLGVPVKLFTALGTDMHADRIITSCRNLSIDLHSARVQDVSTSTYLYVADENGDMACAISDMEVCDYLTPSFFEKHMGLIDYAAALVLDTNLPEASIRYLVETSKAPVFVDPVSVTKAGKLKEVLSGIHTIKPNRLEAELLTGRTITTKEEAKKAAKSLLEQGVKQVFLSLGTKGVIAASDAGTEYVPSLKSETVSLTGAGDAFMAGIVYAYFNGADLVTQAKTGSAAAAVAIESMETINERLSPGLLRRILSVGIK